jgi:EAL domain-containing protein (putative c-di-GMP-specific phosphodiesterase class I)
MLYNYFFDICAIFILITIALVSLSRRWVPAYRQRAYSMLFLAVFSATLAERVETYLQMYPSSDWWYHPVEMITGSVYFVAHLGSGFFYLIYILSVLDIFVDIRKRSDFITIFLGFFVGIALVIVNFFIPVLFYYDENGMYHRQPLIAVYYMLAAYFMCHGLALIFRYKKIMRRRTKAVILSYVVLVSVGILIQYFFPTVLVENLMSTISITLVYISLQNPSEMVDDYLNILNRRAFLEGLDIKTERDTAHNTIFVTIDNIRSLSDEIGYVQAQSVLKKIARYLKTVGGKDFGLQTYTYRFSEYVFAVNVHSVDNKRVEQLLKAIASRLHEPWSFSNMAIRVEGHCFNMKYPDHYKTSAELMNKVDVIIENVEREPEAIINLDESAYAYIKKGVDYDLIARNSIDNRSAVVKFQPMLSKVYRINYCADAVCFMIDEYGNEVDMRGHIPDIKVTQALMDTDEYVYRHTCRALTFWNAGDRNGKYRAIVGMSQGEISRTDFIRRIKKILREERAEASWITLKLTETTITTMNAVAERNLKLLGEMKCSIIVDRFGSGYSGLDRILSLPVVQINLDHELLLMADESEKMKIVLHGIVDLFHDISIFVGVSDINSAREKEMAENIGCDFLIGDYLSRPMKDSSYVNVIDDYFDEG